MTTTWLEESRLCPYAAVQTLPARRLLVLAPHPDDEVLGCGGLMASALDRGAEVVVVIVTDGGRGGDAAQRELESRAAAQALAPGEPRLQLQFWRLPDRGLVDQPGLVPRLQHLLGSADADCVLLPSPFEIHPDHRALCAAGLQALRLAPAAIDCLFYEVGQGLLPDVLVDITPVLDRKRAALQCFGSQLRAQAYDEQVLGLNRFRAYTLGPAVTHAEAFQRVGLQLRRGGLAAVLADIHARLRLRFDLGAAST